MVSRLTKIFRKNLKIFKKYIPKIFCSLVKGTWHIMDVCSKSDQCEIENLKEIVVQQNLELMEAITGFETENEYKLFDPRTNQQIFSARENSGCCNRNCFGDCRHAEISIYNKNNDEIMRFIRHLRMQSCCFPCCLQKMEIHCPPGNVIGTVNQVWGLCRASLDVKDENDVSCFKIVAPSCVCGHVHFEIYETGGHKAKVNQRNFYT